GRTRSGPPPAGPAQQLGRLYRESAGEFRQFALVVTRDVVKVKSPGTPLLEAEALALYARGGHNLPDAIGELPFAGYHCHVLVYRFERTSAGGTAFRRSEDPSRGATRELKQAGFPARLVP